MNYIGSKYSLLDFIDESIREIADPECNSFCDLFAGTGIVGRHFKKKGYAVIANDMQHYSYVLNRHYIQNNKPLLFKKLENILPELQAIAEENKAQFVCDYLSEIESVEGFIYQNYCLGGTIGQSFERLYFSDENGKKCDAIRQKTEQWKNENLLSDDEYYFLLTSMIESIDKLANTASVYGAYLKKIKKSASKTLKIIAAEHILSNHKNKVFNEDANVLIKKIKADIVYLDPPYNHRQYAPNYHLLETISRYDNPVIKGKTGLRDYSHQKSAYSSKSKVSEHFRALILNTDARYIFLSYNNEGLLSLEEIKKTMSLRGEYGMFTKHYARFKADKTESRTHKADSTTEYLHYVKVQN